MSQIVVVMTELEHATLKNAAAEAGITLSNFIRNALGMPDKHAGRPCTLTEDERAVKRAARVEYQKKYQEGYNLRRRGSYGRRARRRGDPRPPKGLNPSAIPIKDFRGNIVGWKDDPGCS